MGCAKLGPAEGGVRLLYNESLSGVINWSLAAPLFSVNLVFLTALVQRSLGPIRGLFSRPGLVGLVEQAIRVLRWGLWMAPVIYSFLRMAPDPTWYNQDGAVRTAVATARAGPGARGAFRAWSLEVFLGLLAYDWFRVLIWFDHMGLRVATLVNLSFVGGDIADERGARALGHPGRARTIPEGLRRFATWAPLLIPFYIPRGAEWDQVWGEAERMQAAAAALLPPVETVLVGYAAVRRGAVGLMAVPPAPRPARRAAAAQRPPPPRRLVAGPPLPARQRHLHARGVRRRARLQPHLARPRLAARDRPHPPPRRPAAAERQVLLPARASMPAEERPGRWLAADPPRRAGLRGRASHADQPAVRQQPRRSGAEALVERRRRGGRWRPGGSA